MSFSLGASTLGSLNLTSASGKETEITCVEKNDGHSLLKFGQCPAFLVTGFANGTSAIKHVSFIPRLSICEKKK